MACCVTHKLHLCWRHSVYLLRNNFAIQGQYASYRTRFVSNQRRNMFHISCVNPRHKSCLVLRDVHWRKQHAFSTHQTSYAVHRTFDGQPASWLFVSNAAAGAYDAQVNLDLDLDRRLADDSIHSIIENVEARGISFDMTNLVSLYKKLKTFEHKHMLLDQRKRDILKRLKEIKERSVGDSITKELKEVKLEMKSLMKSFWDLEENLMVQALQLPNDLHSETPMNKTEVKKEANVQKGCKAGELTHIELAKKYDLIKFSIVGPKAYYLKEKLSRAEMVLTDAAFHYFHSLDYRLMSGPEFFKTPIMEGCGFDVHNTDTVLTIQHTSKDVEPMLHLAGISPMTFAGKLHFTNASQGLLQTLAGKEQFFKNGVLVPAVYEVDYSGD